MSEFFKPRPAKPDSEGVDLEWLEENVTKLVAQIETQIGKVRKLNDTSANEEAEGTISSLRRSVQMISQIQKGDSQEDIIPSEAPSQGMKF